MTTRFKSALAAVVLLCATAAGVAASEAKRAPAASKSRSIRELAARYDSSACGDCHTDAHQQWSNSAHSRSIFGTGRTAATIQTTISNGLMEWSASGVKRPEDVQVRHLMMCAKCHLPQLADATDEVAQEIVRTVAEWRHATEDGDDAKAEAAQATLTSLNIGCLVCHNRNAITHKWADGYPKADAVYGSQSGEHPDTRFPRMERSPVMSESILCGQCHGLGPNLELENPTQCATAYGSYLFAYVPEGGSKTCQQCHMNESGLGHDMQSYRSQVMAKAAVTMDVEASEVLWRDNTTLRPRIDVRVSLTNHAGHGLPDG